MNPHLEHAIRHWVKTSEGWSTEERVLEMAELVLNEKPETIVEIGIFGGRHMIALAMALKENGKGKFYGIDPWKVEAALEGENQANRDWWSKNMDINLIHQYCMTAIWKFGLDEFAVPIRAASQNCFQIFQNIDLLSIDGNHSEVASSRDVKNYLPLVRGGGIVIMDDVDWPTTKQAVRMVSEKCDLLKDGGQYRIYRKR